MKYLSNSDIETIDIGKKLGLILAGGDVVALSGTLGSGKTWLTKGIGLGFGVSPDEIITSPSFSIVNEYEGRCLLYHMDLYRLETISDIMSTGLDDYFHDKSVVVVEWAERCPAILPSGYINVKIEILGENERSIDINSDNHFILKKIENCFRIE
ncbi:MAG: tRNA (adenosine(37)-N6)-threonylcarbamoyltransferase complex ATPase subunit type 1 TsaE [Deltaproteobacteria bacterium]|nr:tRNA (adenosine(37)-N6)-threonylcarbamoyltransferase complex ATPase subunit type 1 TsaE [Deltaproteobacteria bacterium]